MKKIIVLLLITVTLLVCFTTVVSATAPTGEMVSDEGRLPFEDVKDSHWFADALEFCYANGIIKGMNDYTFGFSGQLTRAQFVTMLASLEGVDTSAYTVDKFTDVKSSHWWYGAIAWAYNEGIVSGMNETMFAPNGVLTRAQLATVMRNYMEGKYEVELIEDALDSFPDKPKESYWYYDAMKYSVSAGLLSGNSNGTLDSTGKVTRAQAVVIFKSFMEKYFYGDCEHIFTDADCTNSAVCSECGLIKGLPLGHRVSGYNCTDTTVCNVCGSEVAPGNIMHNFAAATCTAPRTCTACGVTRGSAEGHEWVRADCVNPKRCNKCNLTEGSALTTEKRHTWWAATCINPKMCKVCYTTEGWALGHRWKAANCVDPKTCTRCKLTEGLPLTTEKQHTWWAATCHLPKMCKVCYVTEGEKLTHKWMAATCYSPETCVYCKAKRGSVEHKWSKVSCTTDKKCTICGKVDIKALGHNMVNHLCTRCGYIDSDDLFVKLCCSIDFHGDYWIINNKKIKGINGGYEEVSHNDSVHSGLLHASENEVYMSGFYNSDTGESMNLIIYINGVSKSYRYWIVYKEWEYDKSTGSGKWEQMASAYGYIDPAKVSDTMTFTPANYSSKGNLRVNFNDLARLLLLKTVSQCGSAMNEYCGCDLSDFGFVNY